MKIRITGIWREIWEGYSKTVFTKTRIEKDNTKINEVSFLNLSIDIHKIHIL